ncbi:hypothetical protein A9179_01925 [Pseudomonas alcaligenes]|uniref:DUF2141 domain-containing protein n=1 Tax=Aquipseudomonas alcaligenes TaxID=43263 RepID=A0ABR7RUZ8_AQUAC|nr:DUF2141 domain-containing protein [Pseudomonas alcaligenes]MBC9249025.1 hypothetical protein [Pseudomonas alcaligenes]
MPQRILQTVTALCRLAPLALLLVCPALHAGDILVRLEGQQDGAALHLALVFADQPDWDGRILRQIESQQAPLRLRNLPPGRYALQLYQDSNGNGRLDLSPRGIPLEPVGFSANPSLLNGKPTPRQCLFEHAEGDTEIVVRLRSKR